MSRTRTLPPLAGGQDPLAVLEDIRKQLAEGGQTPEQQAQLAAEAQAAADAAAAQAAAPVGETPMQELERLRAEQAKRATEDAVKSAAAAIGTQMLATQAQQRQGVEELLVAEVTKFVSGGETLPAVEMALKGIRAPSRFVGQHASDDFVAKMAAGGQGIEIHDPRSLQAGVDLGFKEFVDSKSFARFFQAVYKSQRMPLALTAVETKALAEFTDSAGGYLVPPEWMDDILTLLRASTVVMEAGPRVRSLGKKLNQVSISAGGTAYWGTENSATTPSQETFAETVLLTPKTLTALVPASNHLLQDSSKQGIADAEEVIRNDLSEIMGLAVDLGFLQGSGAPQPLGLKNISGITDLTTTLGVATDGDYFDDDLARNMLASYRTMNVRAPRLAWFFNPVLINQLEGLKDNEGRYLLETKQLVVNPDQRTGTLWGVPFYTTTQIPTNITRGATGTTTYVLLVNMPELIVGESRDLVIDTSTDASYTPDGGTTWVNAFQNRQTLFRSEWRGDIGHRRPSQIVLLQGIKTV